MWIYAEWDEKEFPSLRLILAVLVMPATHPFIHSECIGEHIQRPLKKGEAVVVK